MGYVSSGGSGGGGSAASTTYDNATSGITPSTVQGAVDLLAEHTTAMRFWRPDYTFSASAVSVADDTVTITEGHHIGTGTVVVFDTTWGGFTSGVQYNAIRVNGTTLKFADSRGEAMAGIARDINGTPSGSVLLTSVNGQNVAAGSLHRTATQLTYSFGDNDVDPTGNTITIPDHPFATGHGIQFSSTWGGVSSGTLYYAIKVDKDTIKVASSDYLARIGTAVDITADPGGTVSLFGCYGNMLLDAFVAPDSTAEYVVSTGYGGAHLALFGFSGGARPALTGNLSTANGSGVDIGINSGNDTAFEDKPVLISLMIYAGYAVVFMNGVPCKRFAKATGRGADTLGVDTLFYIGGSDHSNYEGDIYWVRLFENGSPVYFDPNVAPCLRTSPRPAATYWETVTSQYITACGLWDFTSPATTFQNLGIPLYSDRTNNAVRGAGTHSDTFGAFNSFAEYELPQQVAVDPLARPDYGLTPTAVPAGAKIFDSFKRNDVTYTFSNYLGLGNTEGGSLGVQRWRQTHPASARHGILFGRAFVEGTGTNTTREYVNNDSPYMKVTIRNNGNETEGAGLFAAYDFDADTGIMVIHNAGDTITLYKVATGTPTSLGSYVIPGTNVPYTLGIEYTSTRQIKLLVDDTAQVTYDDSGSAALSGVSTGFTASVGYCRFEDFAVYAASA